MIDATWTPITANQSLKLFARKFAAFYKERHGEEVTFSIDHGSKRPDFTLVNLSHRIHTVEIKAAEHVFDNADWDRLHNYLEAFQDFFAANSQLASEFPKDWVVDLVCDDVRITDRDKSLAYKLWHNESRIRQISWDDFLARAERLMRLPGCGGSSPRRGEPLGHQLELVVRAVSLFSNCGAGDVGFAAAGFQFRVVSELVEKRLEVARLNHPDAVAVSGIFGDLAHRSRILSRRPRLEAPVLLSGCPPCQGMSSARGDRGKESDPDVGSRDGRNLLVLPIAEVAKKLRPMFIVVENVPAFLRRRVWDPDSMTPRAAAKILCNRLESDYCVYAAVVDLCEFGIPQHRSRAFLTFVRKDTDALSVLKRTGRAPFPAPTHGGPDTPHFVTVDDALRESACLRSMRDPLRLQVRSAIRCTEFPFGLTRDTKWWPRYHPEAVQAHGNGSL